MNRWVGVTAVAVIGNVLVLVGGCGKDDWHCWTGCINEDYCCTTPDCADEPHGIVACGSAEAPFCDNEGSYPASGGIRRTCIPDPLSSSCLGPEDCTTTAERPYCLDGICVECTESTECGTTAPACNPETHLCTACTLDTDCLDHAGTPRCFVDDGTCVGCLEPAADCTEATAPVCDEDAHACRGCASESECASDACDTATGACFAEADVIYLAPGGAAGSCTQAAPCATFAQGFAQVAGTRNVVKAAAGTYGEFTVNALAVTVLGNGATVQSGANDQDLVTVTNGADVTIVGLTIRNAGGTGRGVVCGTGAASTVALQGATVRGNAGGGVSASNCTVTLESSTVSGNAGGGVSISGGTSTLRNTWVVANGGPTAGVGGVKLDNIAGLMFEFNTVADNVTNSAFAAGIQCSALSPVVLSNSIVHGSAANQIGSPIQCSYAHSMSNQSLGGSSNVSGSPSFVNAGSGDYHLAPTSTGVDAADPAATLAIDIDGDARPQGTARDMGADEVLP